MPNYFGTGYMMSPKFSSRVRLVFLAALSAAAFEALALDQLYDKDKSKLKADLYVSCLQTNKSTDFGSVVTEKFLESHCKCFSEKLSSQASTDKQFVKSFNDKNSEEQMAVLGKLAPPLNQACFQAATEKYGETSLTAASPDKISDKVGLSGVEKIGFIRNFNYQCAQEFKDDPKINQNILTKYCGCLSDYVSTKVSNRDLYLSTKNGANTKRYDSALGNGEQKCLNEIKRRQ